MARLASKQFLTSSSWTAPAGVTFVFLLGSGGGGGGSGGGGNTGHSEYGGGSIIPILTNVVVVPNTSYTITIGAGGAGGAGTALLSPNLGSAGGDTTFGSLATFNGRTALYTGARPWPGQVGDYFGSSSDLICTSGYFSQVGSPAAAGGSYYGGNNGLPSTLAVGPTGGAGNASGVGGNGTAALANSGGGGAAGGCSNTLGGNGGAGGSGILTVIWIE